MSRTIAAKEMRKKRRQRRKRSLLRGLTVLAVGAGVALAALELSRLLFRNNQLFCPSPDPLLSWNPADYGLDPAMTDEVRFESDDGTMLHGWYCRSYAPVASLLYCHGNTGNITYSAACIPKLVDAGLNLFIFDYRGFGRSSGYTTLAGVLQDAEAAAREHHVLRPHDVPSILYGYSLGGAIAAETAQHVYFDGLILQSTFTNLRDMARVVFPGLPMHLVSGNEFDTLRIMSRLKIPLVVIHGREDEVIPMWMGEKLYSVCSTGHAIHIVDGAMHTNLYDTAPDGIVDVIRRFALSLQKGAAPYPLETIEPPTLLDRLFGSLRRTQFVRRMKWLRPSVPTVFEEEPV